MPASRLVNALRVLWAVVILWFELAVFPYQVSQCRWPDLSAGEEQLDLTQRAALVNPTHVLLIADPQVLDHRSYWDRPPWLVWLVQRIVDLNLRKSWWASKWLRPDVVIFLGDMMDGGRFAMSDAEYESYHARFKSIFDMDDAVPVYYIPGNHDVGIGTSEEWSDQAHERYTSHFGPLNQALTIANHTFVLLDAPGLVDEEYAKYISGMSFTVWAENNPLGPIAFVQQAAEIARSDSQPTVLLTHIPLARSRRASCGPLREQGSIEPGRGYGYSNTFSDAVSDMLLNTLRPSMVFSADDHDYCEHHHSLPASDDSPPRSVKEISVKSFSMAMGVRRPGFQLLSLVPPSSVSPSQAALNDSPCVLPFQLGIYVLLYGPLAAVSLLILLIYHISWTFVPTTPTSLSPSATSGLFLEEARPSPDLPLESHTLRVDEAEFILPPPTPASVITGKGWPSHPHTQHFTIGSRKVVVDLSAARDLASSLWCCSPRKSKADALRLGRRRTRLLRALLTDVAAVAWLPITLFVSIMWWFL